MSRLLERARKGSRAALGELWEGCREYLLVIAEKRLGNHHLGTKAAASDLVQQTFMEGQEAFSRFRGGSQGELLAWLTRILLNNVANHRRRFEWTQKRRLSKEVSLSVFDSKGWPVLDLVDDTSSPSCKMARAENGRAVREAIGRLPLLHRQVLELRHAQGRSFREIGDVIGRSANAARMLWVRSLERLADELDKVNGR